MSNSTPLILISNDDGVSAKGINELIDFVRPLGEVLVVAPDSPRSGSACALSANHSIDYSLVRKEEGLTVYQCSGTPVDCIKLAMFEIVERKPDLIVSGINHGSNASINVHYSGTMGIAIEGCLKGIPSVGFSLFSHDADADFTALRPYVYDISKKVLSKGLPPHVCLNVNFPADQEIKGVRVCHQADGEWNSEWNVLKEGDKRCFQLTGQFVLTDSDVENCDHWSALHGYAAITPIHVDMTAEKEFEQIKNIFS